MKEPCTTVRWHIIDPTGDGFHDVRIDAFEYLMTQAEYDSASRIGIVIFFSLQLNY